MDEPDSEELLEEARRSPESIPEHVEEVETEVVDTSEVRISEEETEEQLQDSIVEPEDIAPMHQPQAEPTPTEEDAQIVTETEQDPAVPETEQTSTMPVLEPTPITSTRPEPPPLQAQTQAQSKLGRLSLTVVGWSATGAAVAVIVGLLASGVISIVGGSDSTATPQVAQTTAPAATSERAAATVPPAAPTIPAGESEPSDGPSPTEPPVVAIEPEPSLTVVIVPPAQESNLPWELSRQTLLPLRPALESLVDVDRFTGEYIPKLAEGWEVNGDSTEWIFFLREGVEFHNEWGEFFAGDVLHSLDRLFEEEVNSGREGFWRANIESVGMLDDFTVRIGLFRPVDEFLSRVSVEHNLVILSANQWNEQGEDGIREFGPAGTGPYSYLGRDPGESMHFARVEDHWRQTLNYEELNIPFFPEESVRLAILQTGLADIAQLSYELLEIGAQNGEIPSLSSQPAIELVYFFPGLFREDSDLY